MKTGIRNATSRTGDFLLSPLKREKKRWEKPGENRRKSEKIAENRRKCVQQTGKNGLERKEGGMDG